MVRLELLKLLESNSEVLQIHVVLVTAIDEDQPRAFSSSLPDLCDHQLALCPS